MRSEFDLSESRELAIIRGNTGFLVGYACYAAAPALWGHHQQASTLHRIEDLTAALLKSPAKCRILVTHSSPSMPVAITRTCGPFILVARM